MEERASYVCYGRECSDSGTPHLQGYCEFEVRKTLNQVRLISARAHWEARRGSQAQAVEYCRKDGDFKEFGRLAVSAQGRRSDLDEIAERLRGGASLRSIAFEFPAQYARYHRGIAELARILVPRTFDILFGPWKWEEPSSIQSVVLHGESGIGKTEFAKFLLPRALFISHLDQLATYDPETYDGIIFDDMDFRHLPRESQIHLTDWDNDRAIHIRYMTAFIPKHTRKIFTSNLARVFVSDPAIDRRVTVINLL